MKISLESLVLRFGSALIAELLIIYMTDIVSTWTGYLVYTALCMFCVAVSYGIDFYFSNTQNTQAEHK